MNTEGLKKTKSQLNTRLPSIIRLYGREPSLRYNVNSYANNMVFLLLKWDLNFFQETAFVFAFCVILPP